MREIKFRAWNPNRQQMASWDFIKFKKFLHSLERDSADGLIFMQYTGLKDKNGKEIWEGDILNLQPKYGYFNDGVIVSWSDNEARWVFKRLCNDTGVYPINWVEDCEVIGNTYENPDLLKDML